MPWFRFRKKSSDDQKPDPELEPKPELTEPAAEAAESESPSTTPKRRRGSRG